MNKYQIVFALCLALFFFTAKRSYSPFPDYQIPNTQIVKKRPLPDAKVDVEGILARAEPWSYRSRNSFLVHPHYEVKIIQPAKKKTEHKVAPSQPPPPSVAKRTITPLSPVTVFPTVVVKKERPKVEARLIAPPKPPARPRIIPEKPRKPRRGRVKLTDLSLTRKRSRRPRITKTPSKGPGKEPAAPAEKPYELPLQFQGVISAGSSEGPIVILRDKETGRIFRRRAGQTYNGIRIEKVSPSGVEVNVPTEGLRFRYLDRARKWRQM